MKTNKRKFLAGVIAGALTCTMSAPRLVAAPETDPGADRIFRGPTTYYHNGTYYVQQGTAFAVVSPPFGVSVTALPGGANRVLANGVVYYQYGGIHYRPAFQNGVTVYTTARL